MRRQDAHQDGQVLVQVAMMMVVLLGFLALAVDVSQVYLKRRQLQNAADAAALEGVRQICFEGQDWAAARAPATTVAHTNAPDGNVSFPAPASAWHMTAVVTQSIPSFVASIVGQDVFNPGARATAICGAADRGVGGLWPLTVHQTDFNAIVCGEPFTVFTGQNDNQQVDCLNQCDCDNMEQTQNPNDSYPSDEFFATLLAGGAPTRIDPGERGWLRLFDPPDPLPDECSPHNCGNDERACWLEQTHPGPISCGDQIPGGSGIGWSNGVRDAIEYHVDNSSILSIPLWLPSDSLTCGPLGSPVGSCSGAMYAVNSFGCIRVLGYAVVTIPPQTGHNNCQHGNAVKVIFAERVCPCSSFQGGAGNGPPGDGVRAVSLIE